MTRVELVAAIAQIFVTGLSRAVLETTHILFRFELIVIVVVLLRFQSPGTWLTAVITTIAWTTLVATVSASCGS